MPPVRSVLIGDNSLTISDHTGVKVLTYAQIPPTQNTPKKIETYINTVWIPANITGYAATAHVFSLNPLRLTLWTGDTGLSAPANWWVDSGN